MPKAAREFVDIDYVCDCCGAIHMLQVYPDGRVIDIMTDANLAEGCHVIPDNNLADT